MATRKLKEDVESIIPFVNVSDIPIATAVSNGINIDIFFMSVNLKSESNAVNIVPIIVIKINTICKGNNISLFIRTENNNVYIGYVDINTEDTLKLPFDNA